MGSYLALYRKYRPTSFNTVVGQDYIVRTLKNSIIKGHISHAYLFTGPRGVGKTTIARIFAKSINCHHNEAGEACDRCETCLETNSGSNPDIIEVNASNQTGVNDMRDLLDKVVFLPTMSKYKVYIIDEVHMLSTSSFNALLKTLEEPPKHAIFILCTTEVEKVIPTIRSRCQRFDFHLIDKNIIIDRLDYVRRQENINITNEALSLIADASEGGMRDALSLLDQVSSFSINDAITKDDVINVSGMLDFESLFKITSTIKAHDSNNATILLDELIRSGKEVEKVTSNLINFYKDILIIKNTKRVLDKNGYDRIEFKSLVDSFQNKELFDYIDILSDATKDFRFSIDKRLYLDLALIKMSDIESVIESKPTFNEDVKNVYNPNITYSFKEPKVEEPVAIKEETKPIFVPEPQIVAPEIKIEEPIIEQKTESNAFNDLFNNVNEDEDENVLKNVFSLEDKETLDFLSGDEETIDSIENAPEEASKIVQENEDANIINLDEPIKEETNHQEEEINLFSFEEEEPRDFSEKTIPSVNNLDTPTFETKTQDAITPTETTPVQETTVENIFDEKKEEEKEEHYGIKFIESVLNNADKPFKERNIILLEKAMKESRGSESHKYALLLEGARITASSRTRMIITFNEVGYCNLVMKEENILGIQKFFKDFMSLDIDFMALPFSYWKTVSDEFVIKYKANREKNITSYITLSDIKCPGLKINSSEPKKERDNKFQEVEDMFGDIIS